MNAKLLAVIILVVAAITGASAYLFLRPPPAQPVSTRSAPSEGHMVKPSAAVTSSATPAPTSCLLPGPAPVPPDGATATAADMKLGHDVMQHFVNELETYQACRDAQADHADPGVSDAQRQEWIKEGDAAIDQANFLAHAFSVQLQAFKAQPK